MRKMLFISLMFISSQAYAADIYVTVQGLKNNHGQVLVSLYHQAKPFPTHSDKALETKRVTIDKTPVSVSFTNIPEGVYAIAVVHDENGNGVLDTNFFGIPNEGVGVSNHARGHMGPPSFKDASFVLKKVEKQRIQIHY
jgi:uncharacterized protein (DUF2141 family)